MSLTTTDIDLETVASLFEVQLSERSGLLRSIMATEELLREYELATTTNFVCIKEKKGFGNTGK